tara:strand:+ start:492 stop:701 length:210 start_codon:yes stop_codon:yes gene_type:complete
MPNYIHEGVPPTNIIRGLSILKINEKSIKIDKNNENLILYILTSPKKIIDKPIYIFHNNHIDIIHQTQY